MTANIIIRNCQQQDIQAITAIYAEAVLYSSATFEISPPNEVEMLQRRAKLINNNYPYLVAELEGFVIGYAYAGPYRERPAFLATVEDSIYIHKNFQGKGIGQLLLQQLIIEAENRNFRQMIAVIGDSANQGSIKLHSHQNFQLIGTLYAVGWKHERWLDTVLMQRSLGVGNTQTY